MLVCTICFPLRKYFRHFCSTKAGSVSHGFLCLHVPAAGQLWGSPLSADTFLAARGHFCGHVQRCLCKVLCSPWSQRSGGLCWDWGAPEGWRGPPATEARAAESSIPALPHLLGSRNKVPPASGWHAGMDTHGTHSLGGSKPSRHLLLSCPVELVVPSGALPNGKASHPHPGL